VRGAREEEERLSRLCRYYCTWGGLKINNNGKEKKRERKKLVSEIVSSEEEGRRKVSQRSETQAKK